MCVYQCECVCTRVCVSMHLYVCGRVCPCVCLCMFVRVHVCACATCVYSNLACVYVLLCRVGSHVLPDGTNMFQAAGKDGVIKVHEVSVDIGFVG